jgi:hypothetical protein
MEWISVEEKFPELKECPKYPEVQESEWVIAWYERGDKDFPPPPWPLFLYKLKDDKIRWGSHEGDTPPTPTHWMPLPEPPEE